MRIEAIVFAFLVGLALGRSDFHEDCHTTLRTARLRIENVADTIASREIDRLTTTLTATKEHILAAETPRKYSTTLQEMVRIRDDQKPCPQPNATIFTTSTQSTTTVTTTTAPPTTTGPSNSPSEGSTTSSGASTTSSFIPDPTPEETKFKPMRIHTKRPEEEDPFSWYMKTLYYYMGREDQVCNNEIKDLNSITEDQLFGYFSTLAAAHPGPFCSLCHRFAEEVHTRVLKPNSLLITDDEYHISHLFYSNFPAPKTICTAIAPACEEDYADKVKNLTESVICLECTACMSVTNVLQHKLFLQKKTLDATYDWLRGNLFHNLCAELCMAFQPYNITLFPNGFTYDGCQNVMKKKFYQLIEVATVITRPERFCSLELQWCELNEQPNAIHCLRELCQEYFKDTPQTRWLCNQIPDRPAQADAFLNIRQSKVAKEKKEYHVKFEQRNLHDEL
uniref:Saposin B-type domain-containing protein n=1 Tax=Caenorhabditis japonica TaxID=281687 RepID=A0A8R1HH01_CAEJA